MSGTRLDTAKSAISGFIDSLYPTDYACIITFNTTAEVCEEFTNDKTALKSAVESLDASGGTDTDSGLSAAINEFTAFDYALSDLAKSKHIIMICDGDVNYNETTVNSAMLNGIKIHTINIGDNDSSDLLKISSQTGGQYYFISELDDIFGTIGMIQSDTVDRIDTTDTDLDGVYDIYETKGIRLPNGVIIYTSTSSGDTDNDTVIDGDEIGTRKTFTVSTKSNITNAVYFSINSIPTQVDSDGDGYNDDIDPNPLKKDVIEYTLRDTDFNKVIYKGSENYYYYTDAIYYGGNQGWFADDIYNTDSTSKLIENGGCGLLSGTDIMLYIGRNDARHPKLEGIKYGLSFTRDNAWESCYSYTDYSEFVREMEADYITPIGVLKDLANGSWTIGVNPLQYVASVNKYIDVNGYTDLNASLYFTNVYGSSESYMTDRIIKSIMNDTPVAMMIGTGIVGMKGCTTKYNIVSDDEDKNFHWVTITGVEIYALTNKVTFTIASWGGMYKIDVDDFYNNAGYLSSLVFFE